MKRSPAPTKAPERANSTILSRRVRIILVIKAKGLDYVVGAKVTNYCFFTKWKPQRSANQTFAKSDEGQQRDNKRASVDRNSASLPGFFPACRVYSNVQDTFCRSACPRRTCNDPAAGHNNRPATGRLRIAPFPHDDDGSKARSSGGRCVSLLQLDLWPSAIS